MYLVVYGLRNAGLTEYLSGVSTCWRITACGPRRSAPDSSRLPLFYYEQYADGTGWRVVHDGSTASGVIKEAMVYANVIGAI